MNKHAILALLASTALAAEPPEPKFRAVTIDDKIQIGYGVAVADVDGDAKPDILLADKRQIVWYRNPGQPPAGAESFAPAIWNKFVIAENLTEKDNVCLAAQDIDGDGKCELAIGAEWNPGDTEKSGAVFYLIAPADRTQRWEPVKFPSVEPTTHRMRWIKLGEKEWGLVVVPLHGRGNKNGEGAPVKVLLYHKPADVRAEWKSEVVDESMHMTHNFDVIVRNPGESAAIWLGGKEGVTIASKDRPTWSRVKAIETEGPAQIPSEALQRIPSKTPPTIDNPLSLGVGEVRFGRIADLCNVIASVEPMHGNHLVAYVLAKGRGMIRRQLTDKLTEGHALACGDLLSAGADQIVVGWRGTPGKAGSTTGVAVWTALDDLGEKWRETVVDPDGMACEDLVLADLNGDGKLDIIASGRATKNVKVYFNETPR